MARADLSAMLGRLDDTAERQVDTPLVENTVPSKPAVVSPKARPARPVTTPPVQSIDPPYLRLERKETRLRLDQYAALTQHARRLNKLRGSESDRITENTLIRVAIDLLLARIDDVTGQSEAELTESVIRQLTN